MCNTELSILNPERKTLPGPEHLHHLINWSCASATAIDFWTAPGDRRYISYGALDDLTSTLAEQITERLKATDSDAIDIIVPILIPQSPELYISWIAILKAGAAVCPVPVDAPAERVAFILQDVGASLVLTTPQHEEWIAEITPHVDIVCVSQSTSCSTTRRTSSMAAGTSKVLVQRPDSLAYIMYTSGSTGLPKGVKIGHSAVCQALLAHDEHLPPFKRFLQFASPTFDVSVFEIFFPLFRGATLAGRNRDSMLADLTGTICTMGIDAAELTPTVASTLLKSRDAVPCLQLLLTIGEMLSKPVIEEFGESTTRPGILYAMYGPTEASIHCTVAPRLETSSSSHSIGQPFSTVTAAVLGTPHTNFAENCMILPRGEIGELAVAGQLASGYLNRPEQTSAAFVDVLGFGLFYRTGDRARIANDGNLEILGRISSGQVKLRGQRVELGEIENVACGANGVIMAAATIIKDSLVLFCVQDGIQATVANIREICERRLLSFMIPGDIVLLDLHTLPRLPSGKMDRKKIEADYAPRREIEKHDAIAPMDTLTSQICETVSGEIGRQVSPMSLLRSEGLNSLMAIKIASALRAHGIDVSVRDLLQLETIADLVPKIVGHASADQRRVTSKIALIEHTEAWEEIKYTIKTNLGNASSLANILPCNAIQLAMLAETMSNTRLNFNLIEVDVDPSISLSAVSRALRTLAHKNEILRSGFIPTDDVSMPFAQVVWKELDFDHELSLLHPLKLSSIENKRSKLAVHIHHALYDGWSWDLIMADLNDILAKKSIPDRPQFQTISHEQRVLQSFQKDIAREYWRGLLQNATPSRLPQLSPSLSSDPKHLVERYTLQTPANILSELAIRLRISSQTILAAAVSFLLSTYIGSSHVVLGLVSSGRHLPVPEIEKTIGPCLSTFPLRVDFSTMQTVQDALLHVRDLELCQLEHGTLSLREILATAMGSSHQNLFDTLFVWQQSLLSSHKVKKLVRTSETRDCSDYTMIIEAEPLDLGVVVSLSYDVARLSPQLAQKFLAQMDYLVTKIVDDQKTLLVNIWEGLDSSMLAMANPTPKPFDRSFDLVSTILRLAQQRPETTAVSFAHDFDPVTGMIQTKNLTYGELYAQSSLIACTLQKQGVGLDDIVCLIIEKSLDLYVFDLAIILAGAAFLNVDIRTPPERVCQILREVKCKTIISTSEDFLTGHSIPGISRLISISSIKEDVLQYQGQRFYPETHIDGSRLAYAVTTSGTTGVPKAILVTRQNLLSNIDILSKTYPGDDKQSVLLQACSPAFDVFVFELFWTWHMGYCLSSATNDILFRDIEGFIRAAKVSHLSLTPSVAALIHPDNVPHIGLLVTAGEPMNSKVFNDWAGRGLYQGYGPAETTNICNVTPVERNGVIHNVGAPFANTSIFICAQQKGRDSGYSMHILPVGAMGEILIGGEQVARGYADRSLTAKSFIDTTYGRLYRSGDMGRLLANGDLLVLGRQDDQVKLRGQRIELGDVNSAVAKAPVVKDAVTLVSNTNNTKAQIVTFWAAHGSERPPNSHLDIYELLENTLQPYMIPDYLIPIHAMPLTRQGKIDKNSLLKHFQRLELSDLQAVGRSGADVNLEEDFTVQEKLIADIVSEVIDIPLAEIKPSTSLYSLGLDSLSSVRLSQKLRKRNLGQVDVSSIMKYHSVRKIWKAMENQSLVSQVKPRNMEFDNIFPSSWREKVTQSAKAEGKQVESFHPCTALQESILVSQATYPDAVRYEARMEFAIKGDWNNIAAAWSHLIRRHQILRTGFAITPSTDHAYAQILFKHIELPILAFKAQSSTFIPRSTDSINPPWSLILDRAHSDGPILLTLVMSHALYDFQALTLLLKEIEQIVTERELAPVVSPNVYYEYMLGQNMDGVDEFWKNRLKDYKPLSFAALFSSEKSAGSRQRTYTLESRASQQEVQVAAERSTVTSSALHQTAWARLLSCYFASQDFVFGNVFNGRNLPIEGLEYVAAPLFNTLPIRIKMKSGSSIRALTATVHGSALEILPFQPSALRRIARNQKLDGKPLFDTLLLIQSGNLALDENIWTLRSEQGDMDFPGIILEVIPDAANDAFKFKLHVQSEGIDPSTAEQVLRNYDVLLHEIIRYPQSQADSFTSIISNLPLLHAGNLENPEVSQVALDEDLKSIGDEKFSDLGFNIRDLFARFSGINPFKIQKNTSIFELGLDSLHVVQIASELRGLGYDITGADVLEARTIAKLSQTCKRPQDETTSTSNTFDLHSFNQNHIGTVCEQLKVSDKGMQVVRPCTPTQSGILTEFINSSGRLYFNSIILELSLDIDLHLLQRAWQTVMDRNEMLRTGFINLNTPDYAYGMITYIEGAKALPWLDEDGSDVPTEKSLGESCLQNLQDPCWCLLLRDVEGRFYLEVHLLHALYDAKSLEGLLSEVAIVYQDGDSSLPITVPVAPALGAVLAQSDASQAGSNDFWGALGANAQPSKFPNLNINQCMEQDTVIVSETFDSLLPVLEMGCRRMAVTLQSLCQIAWAQLLAAYTGETKVTFGIVLSGRTLPETAKVLFPTINTLPFSIDVGDDIFAMFEEATETNVGMYKYQFTPFTTIKRWFDIERDLYDTILILQKNEDEDEEAVARPWKVVEDRVSVEYSLSMEVLPHGDEKLELRITAQQDVVPLLHAKILLSQYAELLRNLVQENPRTQQIPRILRSTVVAKDERIPTNVRLLHNFVESTTMNTPNAVALEFADIIANGRVQKRSWTYRQLNEESNRVVHLLLKYGVRPGEFVAVCFDKCPEASFAILGVLKAGCAYVAIDPAAPAARKRFILEDAKCGVLLTTKSLIFPEENGGRAIMLPMDDHELVCSYPKTDAALEREVQPSDTCYCLYTSGTTGQPKGCLITHASAVQAMLSFQRIFTGHWDNHSRWLQFASFHFDVSVLEQYWSWSVGICVTSAPRDVLFEDIAGAIDALQITHLDLTPSLARLLKPEEVPSLCRGVFIVGGEQVTQDIIDTWGDFGCLYNFYGPSEVTIGCTVHRRVKKGVKATNIGQPWDNVGAFVLKPGSEEPVLRGAVGELCLSGPLVGQGYLNRPDLTAEKFVPLAELGVRVYRSGDLVRLLHDDSFEFLGRIDDQVKLRGQRLEIREIDHAVKQASSSILDLATMVIQQKDQRSEQLVAFFTLRGHVKKSSEIAALKSLKAEGVVSLVRRRLLDKLPAYMVPTHLLPISHIPLSANNKADFKALRACFGNLRVRPLQNMDWDGHSIVPVTETMKRLVKILVKFLQLPEENVTPSSRLFELGLDSISAVTFASLLRKEGYKSADAATIMRRPIVADLAYELDDSGPDEYQEAVEAAKDGIERFREYHEKEISSLKGTESFWPCTPLQEDMLAKTINRGETAYYLSVFHYALAQSVKLEAVVEAWEMAQRRYPILRTTFKEVAKNRYAQVVHHGCVVPVNYRHLGPEEDALAVLNTVASEWCNNVDVRGDTPAWEVEVVQTLSGRIFMSLRIFHGLYDANSLQIILKDIAGLIRKDDLGSGKTVVDYHGALPYGPFCRRAGAEDFWSTRLSTPVLLNLQPVPNGIRKPSSTYSVEHSLPENFTVFKHKLKVVESAIFQSAYLLALYDAYGSFPTFGMVVSGRSFPMTGVEDVCGPLFNTIPVQVQPKKGWTHSDLIQALHDFNINAKPFEHTSLAELRRWADLDSGKQLYDTLFVFQKADSDTASTHEDLWTDVGQNTVPDHPLNIEVELHTDTFKFTVVVDAEFVSERQLQCLASSVLRSFKQLVTWPTKPIQFKDCHEIAQGQGQSTIIFHGAVDVKILEQVKSQIGFLVGKDRVDFTDDVNLLSLGLDSISFIRLSGALKNFGLSISVNMIMRLSTPSSIAQYLTERREQSPKTTQELGLDPEKLFEASQIELLNALKAQNFSLERTEKVLPVSPMQEGILASFEKYYHFALLKLAAETDLDRLRSAWNFAVKAHGVLRATFVAIEDPTVNQIFAQLILKPEEKQWRTHHLENPRQLQDLVTAKNSEMAEAVLAYPSLILESITVTGSSNRYVLLGMSHAIYDGWSIQLLHQDVARFYNERQVQRPPIEPYLQYILSRWGGVGRCFWKEQLSGYSPRPFPSLKLADKINAASYKVTLDSRIGVSTVRQFCMNQSVTTQALGLTIWTLVLAYYTQTRDICFGVVSACRNTENADQLMFPTFNTVPFRLQLDGGSYLDLLRHIHQLSIHIAEHENFPLKDIKQLHSASTGSSTELFDTLFVLQKTRGEGERLNLLYEEVDIGETLDLEYPVNVEMNLDDNLSWTVAARGTSISAEGVRAILERLEEALDTIVQFPDGRIIEIPEEDNTHPAQKQDNSVGETQPSSFNTVAQDDSIRDTVFASIASVARCDIKSLSGETNIYSIGLDSISIIKVTAILRKENITLPVSKIITAVTLDRIVNEAKRIGSGEQAEVARGLAISNVAGIPEELKGSLFAHAIPGSAIDAVLPASAGQIFMLNHYQASGGRLFYPTFRYKLVGRALNKMKICKAWNTTISTFPALRSRFIDERRSSWQVVIKPEAIEQYRPAAQLTISREGDEIIIEIQLHHALYDAISLPLMISVFESACRGESSPVSKNEEKIVPRSLPAFVAATRGDATAPARKKFWTRYLDCPFPLLASGNTGTFETKRVEVFREKAIGVSNTASLVARAAREGISLQALFIAVVGSIVADYESRQKLNAEGTEVSLQNQPTASSASVVCLGIYISNRGLDDIPDLDVMPVLAVNVVPLVVSVYGDVLECAREVQRDLALVQRAEHCGVTTREIYEWTGGRTVRWCVNFLPGPPSIGSEEGGDAEDMYRERNTEGDGKRVRLVPFPRQKAEDTATAPSLRLTSPFLVPSPPLHGGQEAKKPEAMPWCVPCVDIEARLEPAGELSIGGFAPEDAMSERELEEVVVAGIVKALVVDVDY